MRVALLRLGSEEHVLLVTLHHIAADGWSLGILLREITATYDAFLAGREPELPELPIQYADYARWLRRWLDGPVLAQQVAYWRERLAGVAPLDLPLDRPRPAVATARGAQRQALLPPALGGSVEALARRVGVTPFMVFSAVFAAQLTRTAGQSDITLGTPVAGRTRPELEQLVGCFVNTLVLRVDAGGDPSFAELLGRVRVAALGAYAHQDVPFEKVVEEVRPERDTSRTPLFQVMFTLQEAGAGAGVILRGLRLEPLEVDPGAAQFDLTLTAGLRAGGGVAVSLEYCTDLFDGATVERLLGHFETLAGAGAAAPERRLSELAWLTPAERSQVLREWSAEAPAASTIRPDARLERLISERAAARPGAAAVLTRGRTMTYGELDRRAGDLARRLRALGVGPEVPVAVCLGRSADWIIALLGVLRAGGAFVPLDPSSPEEHLAGLLADCGAPILLSTSALAPRMPVAGRRLVELDRTLESPQDHAPSAGPSELPPELLAYTIFTSGTSGRPKGVLVSRGALTGHCREAAARYGLGEDDVVLQFSSLSFDAALEQIFPALLAGACLLLRGEELWNPAELAAEIERAAVTVLDLPLAYWRRAVEKWSDEEVRRVRSRVRLVLVGGEPLTAEDVRRWLRRGFAGTALLHAYGPTEATITATCHRVGERDASPVGTSDLVPIGRPFAGRRVVLLDRQGAPVPAGVAGELHLGGAGLARGYLGQPGQTAERFVPDPWSPAPGARLYRTGDLARHRSDGELEFLGRADQQVKIRGFRVEPAEIEAALCEHLAVASALVLAQEAGDDRRLVAYVVPRGAAPAASELLASLRRRLPAHMVPAAVVAVAAFPMTTAGKVDRRALASLRGPVLPPAAGAAPAAAEGELERCIAALWREVLGRRAGGARRQLLRPGRPLAAAA